MEIMLTKKDVEDVVNFIEKAGLVTFMNDAGLSFASMGFVLTTLSNACEEVFAKMEEEN